MLTCRNPWLNWRTALSQLSGDLGIFGCRSFCPFWSPSLKKKGDLETSLSPPKKKKEFLVFSTSKWPFCFTRHLLRWNCLNLILIYLDWLLDVFEFEQTNACSGRASLIIRWDMLTFCGKGTYTYIHYESYTVYSICCIYIYVYMFDMYQNATQWLFSPIQVSFGFNGICSLKMVSESLTLTHIGAFPSSLRVPQTDLSRII